MKSFVINTFNGGQAEDTRNPTYNQYEDSVNFDIFSNGSLIQHIDQINETGTTIDDNEITDVGMTTISGNDYMVAFGYESSISLKPASYTRSIGTFNGGWSSQQAIGSGSYTYAKATYIQYQGVSFVLSYNGTTWSLQKYTATGTMTSVGTITTSSNIFEVPRPYIHPQDDILYVVVGDKIAYLDGASGTLTTISLTIPTGYKATGLTHWDGYIAIGITPNLVGENYVLFWNRNTTADTFQRMVSFGQRDIQFITNVNGNVMGVCASNRAILKDFIDIKMFAGGEVEVIKKIGVDFNGYRITFAKKDEVVYFGVGGSKALYAFGKNRQGQYVVTRDRMVGDNVTPDFITAINFVGDYCYIAFNINGVNYLTATHTSSYYANDGTFRTAVNQGMPASDKSVLKKLYGIQFMLKGKFGSTTPTLKYYVDGDTSPTSLGTTTIDDGIYVIESTNESDGKPLREGREYRFEIAGSGFDIVDIRYRYDTVNQVI